MSRRKPLCQLSERHVRRLIAKEINNEPSTSVNKENVYQSTCTGTVRVTSEEVSNVLLVENPESLETNMHNDISNTSSAETNDFSATSEKIIAIPAEKTLNSQLATWAINSNINLTHCTKLLKILKQHKCFSELPSDARTLLNTPRVTTELVPMSPGHYIHFGLENGLNMLIRFYGENTLGNEIKLTVNIDGLPLFKAAPYSFWPILASFDSCSEIFIIGVFYGESKPTMVNEFLHPFVEEFNMLSNEQLPFNSKTFKIILKNIVCDAPAKSYILNVKGHSGYSSCTKCKIEGVYKSNRVCFPETVVNALRSDEEFKRKDDDDFHLPGFSPLITISEFDIIRDTPYDYMHLICLGVVKKLLLLWQVGSLKYRLPHQKIELISQNLLRLRKYTPVEFCRKPRSMKFVKYWKATEFRQLLLYIGFTVISQVVSQDILTNFLSLAAGVRILCTKNTNINMIEYAGQLLNYFVHTFKILYGDHHMSHNIHGILHIKDDVKHHGCLDSYSCFKFENYMQKIKSHIRKPEKALQQLKRRYEESCSQLKKKKRTLLKYNVLESSQHFDGPVIHDFIPDKQFRKATCNGFIINLRSVADCIFSLRSTKDIVKVLNIAEKGGTNYIVCQKFSKKEDLFSSPCLSSLIGIYFVSQLNPTHSIYFLEDLEEKFYCMPHKKTNIQGFIVTTLLHRE